MRRGFTLVEILMVVSILGIISALVLPQMGSRDDLRLAAAARTMTADIMYAQSRAITTGTRHFVRIDGGDVAVCVLDGESLVPITHPVTRHPFVTRYGPTGPGGVARPATPGIERVTIAARDFDGAGTQLGFDELGTPLRRTPGTGVVGELVAMGSIELRPSGDASPETSRMTLRVEPVTGTLMVTTN